VVDQINANSILAAGSGRVICGRMLAERELSPTGTYATHPQPSGLGPRIDRSHSDITQEGVSCDLDHMVVIGQCDVCDIVIQVVIVNSTRQLDASAGSNEHFDISADRICLDANVGWHRPGVRKVDRHVSKQGNRSHSLFDVP
jgi:hypothetical protein